MSLEYSGIRDICDRHAGRLRWAMGQMKPLLPFDSHSVQALDDMQLAVLDQFATRFSKLQDAMGAKLFPAILELTKEQGELTTFIDKLNRLEKIGAIESTDQWLALREMRNQFAHDYPMDEDEQAALLNHAYESAEQLLNQLSRSDQFAQRYLP